MSAQRTVIVTLTPEEAARAERCIDFFASRDVLVHERDGLREIAQRIGEAARLDRPTDAQIYGAQAAHALFAMGWPPMVDERDLASLIAKAFEAGVRSRD